MVHSPGVIDEGFGVAACPKCSRAMMVTPSGDVCFGCAYVSVALRCDICGQVDGWRHGDVLRPRWVKILVEGADGVAADALGRDGVVTACNATCAVLAIGRLAEAGRIAVLDSLLDAAHEPPGPAT